MPWDSVVVQVGIIATLAATIGYIWHLEGRGRWRTRLQERFIYGVPWGTVITVVGVIAFYLIAQSGFRHWSEPVVYPFRSWAYTYPFGMFTAGFSHASPDHLTGNMIGTIVLAPLVEYAWGHYPPGSRSNTGTSAGETQSRRRLSISTNQSRIESMLTTPWIRAAVLFPLAMIVVSIFTSFYALGWSLGFSGTVFALLGFAVIKFPVTTVVAMLVMSTVNVLYAALRTPVLVATVDPGGPAPPAWAGINVQAHLLGFLLGVFLALVLVSVRNERLHTERIAFALVLVGLARGLHQFAIGSGGVFQMLRGVGIIFVLILTLLIVAIVATKDKPLLLPLNTRSLLVGGLLVLTVIVMLPSLVFNMPGMADDPVPGDGEVIVDDYAVTYEENATHGRFGSNESGLFVVSEARELWETAADPDELAHSGEETIVVGGFAWRDTVEANRTGWEVDGNDSAYVVDLEHDGDVTRSYTSDAVTARSTIANRTVSVVPEEDEFRLAVRHDGEFVGETAVPETNATATVDGLAFTTEVENDDRRVFASQDGTRVLIAEEERYG